MPLMNSADSNKSGCVIPFLLVWLTGWSAGTLTFDGIAAWGLFKQFDSLTYNEVPGIVTKSETQVDHDSDGTSYRLMLEYSYEVDGIGYTNDRRQYGFESSGRKDVERMAKEYIIEKSIVVYHNPADPEDSVLVRGVSAMDFFLPLFLLPFNLIMIGMFSFTVVAPVRRWFRKRPVTIKVWQRDVIWFAKVYSSLPVVAAGVTALAISFVSIFVVGLGQLLLPAWTLIIPAWCLVIVGSLVAYCKSGPAVRLEIDEFHQRLTVRSRGQTDPEPTDFASIRSIHTRGKTVLLDTAPTPITVSCGSESDAKWLRDWLRERWSGR